MEHEEQLRAEISEFQKEKEKIRGIVGEIGGTNNTQHKVVNLIFIILIVVLLVLGIVLQKITLSLTLEITILLAIFKLIWMFYDMQRTTHFQFWILNSLEFRINDIDKKVKRVEKLLKDKNKETVEKISE